VPIDRVNCTTCGMLISNVANAAEAYSPGEDERFFDDIGCLARDAASNHPGTNRFVWLADGSGWSSTGDAWFAESGSARTPMSHGILAFRSEGAARAADRHGTAHRWDEIVRMAGAFR